MLRQVTIASGQLQGIPAADPRITVYKGVPFAAPPVGTNRWRAPQPVQPWKGMLKAYEFGPMSMQKVHEAQGTSLYDREWLCDPQAPMSEDCLYLNIWTPAMSGDERLPVLVWYFGGALQMGAPNEMEFDGERLARRGIVVVTINYRTNAFGFLCHPEITTEAPHAPANFGNLDQLAATRWVHKNITAFGGDPGRITIAGQSAGGGSVLTQLTSTKREGLCKSAIIQSGVFVDAYHPHFPNRTLREAEQQGEAFFAQLGVNSLEEARALDACFIRDKVLETNEFFGTVEDGAFHTQDNLSAMLVGECLDVPLLLGMTLPEFHDRASVLSVGEFHEMAYRVFGEQAPLIIDLCGANAKEATVNDINQRSDISCIEVALRALLRQSTDRGVPSYFYQFNAEIPGPDRPGAFHSVDLWFFFETLAKCWRPFVGIHYDLARIMCNYWAEFVKKGDPNGHDADGSSMPIWLPYGEDNNTMLFESIPAAASTHPDAITKLWIDKVLGNQSRHVGQGSAFEPAGG